MSSWWWLGLWPGRSPELVFAQQPVRRLELSVDTSGAVTCICIEGELDTGTAPELDQAIQACLCEGTTSMLLDLTATDYVSSMGLRVFLSALKAIKGSGGRMVLTGLNDEVQEIMDMAGFSPLFEIIASASEARASLAA